jgi:hypothetical protein
MRSKNNSIFLILKKSPLYAYFWNSPIPKALRGVKTMQFLIFEKIALIYSTGISQEKN